MVSVPESYNGNPADDAPPHLFAVLDELSDAQRVHLFSRYCAHCGCIEEPEEMRCQCSNDE